MMDGFDPELKRCLLDLRAGRLDAKEDLNWLADVVESLVEVCVQATRTLEVMTESRAATGEQGDLLYDTLGSYPEVVSDE